jgi:hypothetical protein
MALYLRAKDRLSANTQAYLYKWTHIPTQKWYVGSRTAFGSNPSDGYFCSSKIVKPMIVSKSSEWSREILAIGDSKYILDLETSYLISTDAKNDPMCFNRHNGDGKFTSTGVNASAATKNKMSASRLGVSKSNAHRDAIRTGLKNSDLVKNRKGEQTSRFLGYYISPENQKYSSSWEAAKKHKVAATTVRRWAKNNTNGWSFQPKGNH